jgi:membrane-associated protease RseP (regulator of RpoE activity)
MSALGVVLFIAALLVSVMIHEWGHYATARRYGMKVTEFFVGFGPRLWSTRRGETEYGAKAIPAGGYVRIVGMTDLEEVAPEDEERAFYRQPAGRRAIVLAAGSFMHFVIGFALLFTVFAVLGLPKPTTTIAEVAECVPVTATAGCTKADPPSPARAAGIEPGDEVLRVGGEDVEEWAEVTDALRAAGATQITMVLDRDGERVTVQPTLVERERASTEADGETELVGVLWVGPELAPDRANPIAAIGDSVSAVGTLTKATFTSLASIPAKIPDLWNQAFNGEERDEAGLVGPIGIATGSAQIVGSDAPLFVSMGRFLLLMAGLNIFVGLFNLLPLLPLDGGHLAVLGYEQGRSKWASMRGRPDPGRVDIAKLLPAAYLFLGLLVGLSVLLLAADILNPIDLGL